MINIKEGRAGFESIGNIYPAADHVTRVDVTIAGVPCTWFMPEDIMSDDIVIYIHGGAFIFGSVNSHAAMVSHIADKIGRKVLVIDYRLAPENPFPAGLDDCVSVINAIHQDNTQVGFGIMGDSAGGNLAMASQLMLRDQNGPKALYTVVISPWVNLACDTASYERNKATDIILAHPYLLESAKLYAAGRDVTVPYLSPINGDFKNLSPVLILCGTREILEDDSVTLQQQLEKSGVDVTLLLFRDQLHVWPFMDIYAGASQKALDDIADFVGKKSLNQ